MIAMAKGSPSISRLISVLNFFIDNPKQDFNLAQVVKSVKLNRNTCNSIVIGLVDAGYLYRYSDKTYILGPAIMTIARKAQTAFAPIDIARQEMRLLADKLNIVVSVQFREDDELVARERVASVSYLTLASPPDVRYPLHPWGVLFLSALRDSDIEAAFNRAQPPLSPQEREAERRQIAFAREHGYVFAVRDEKDTKRASIRPGHIDMGKFVADLDLNRAYALLFMRAPVFNYDGQVAFELVLYQFKGDFRGAEIAAIGTELVEACKRVTNFITGE
jgi:DNA-binding IclR family transcriptional regulator